MKNFALGIPFLSALFIVLTVFPTALEIPKEKTVLPIPVAVSSAGPDARIESPTLEKPPDKLDIWDEDLTENANMVLSVWAEIRRTITHYLDDFDRGDSESARSAVILPLRGDWLNPEATVPTDRSPSFIAYEFLDAKTDGEADSSPSFTVRVAIFEDGWAFVRKRMLDFRLSWRTRNGGQTFGIEEIRKAGEEIVPWSYLGIAGLAFGLSKDKEPIMTTADWTRIRSLITRYLDAYDYRQVDLAPSLANPDFDSNFVAPEVVIPIGGMYPAFIDYSFTGVEPLDGNRYRVKTTVRFIDYYIEIKESYAEIPYAVSSMVMTFDVSPRDDGQSETYGISRAWKSDVLRLREYEAFPGLRFRGPQPISNQ